MKYRYKRNPYIYEILPTLNVGCYDMPIIKPTQIEPSEIMNLITFNYVNTCKNPSETYVCFYVDDYQFERVWKDPKTAIEILKQFKGVIAPDFSVYADFPEPLKKYNVWRNKVLTALFQNAGINVIPNIQWADPQSYSYCFAGLPKNSVVAISSNGCLKSKVARQLFIDGFKMMQYILEPSKIIVVGQLPKELAGELNVTQYMGYGSMFGKAEHNLAIKG